MRQRENSYTSEKKAGVVIADDHSIVVEGIMSALEGNKGFEVMGYARDGVEAVEKTRELNPDIVVLDISLPRMKGIEAAYKIKEIGKNIKIVVYSMHGESEHIVSMYRGGVEAYVLKDEPISDLIKALEAVKRGDTFFSRQVHDVIREHMADLELGKGKEAGDIQDGIARLSTREKEVFPLLADGISIKDIADRLCISTKTVETHKYNIMDKLNANSVAQLTKIALKKDLISL